MCCKTAFKKNIVAFILYGTFGMKNKPSFYLHGNKIHVYRCQAKERRSGTIDLLYGSHGFPANRALSTCGMLSHKFFAAVYTQREMAARHNYSVYLLDKTYLASVGVFLADAAFPYH